MTARDPLVCAADLRRRRMFNNRAFNGLDWLEVASDQRSLCVHFFGAIPAGLGPANFTVCGGRRITGIKILRATIHRAHDDELDDCLELTLDRPGDFSTYRLCIVGVDGIDPRFACVEFGFKTECASPLDCGQPQPCPAPAWPPSASGYLARDYASFLRLIYDRLALTMPDWRERHAPDLGVTLVELLAYLGDQLSYYQDAVATEAYLDTARLRVSVRRHLRLIDYRMHEGLNARAFVTVASAGNFGFTSADEFYFATDGGKSAGVFEPVATRPKGDFRFRASHSELRFHDWGDGECCLPRGATRATLIDPEPGDGEGNGDDDGDCNGKASGTATGEPPWTLDAGDFLILEEVRGPRTGHPADADPAHRHVVRLSKVERARDELLGVALLMVEWAAADALPFALCLSARLGPPECERIDDVSVARGNVVLVDHGATSWQVLPPVRERDVVGECACEGSVVELRREALPFAPPLDEAPLAHAEPVPPGASAAAIMARDPHEALPLVSLADPAPWQVAHDLLGSDGEARRFVAEIDDEGRATLRFGDGVRGRAPDPGKVLTARYRSGGGARGNVAREAIARLVVRDGSIDGILGVRNPLGARGGLDPQSVAEARLLAPGTIQARRERAVAAEDYAELARRDNPALLGAAANLRWTGSWHEVHVAVDPSGGAVAGAQVCAEVERSLERYRRIGHDLAVVEARQVPLLLRLKVCVLPHHLRAHVAAAVLEMLGNRTLGDGRTGLFHPDRLRFGQSVRLSRIVAAVQAVDGVETVAVLALARLEHPGDMVALETGTLDIAPGEIARLDNDPNFPENGKLELTMGGGR